MAAAALLLAALSAIALSAKAEHHSVLPFDGTTPVMLEGTVVSVLWQNPHTMIAVDADNGRWTIESEGSTALQRLGWSRDALKAGDTVRVIGARAKDGRRLMRCTTITTGGRELRCFGSPS
jgi:hypothetical protein